VFVLSIALVRAPGVGTADQLRPAIVCVPNEDARRATSFTLGRAPQPVSGDIQVESTHHVVVLLAAAVVVDPGVLVGGLAELVPATTVRVMTTARLSRACAQGTAIPPAPVDGLSGLPPTTPTPGHVPEYLPQSQVLAVGPSDANPYLALSLRCAALGQSQQKRPTGTSAWSVYRSCREPAPIAVRRIRNLEDFAPSMWFTGVCLNAMKRTSPA